MVALAEEGKTEGQVNLFIPLEACKQAFRVFLSACMHSAMLTMKLYIVYYKRHLHGLLSDKVGEPRLSLVRSMRGTYALRG